VKATLNEGLF